MRALWVIARNDLQITLLNTQHWLFLLVLPVSFIFLVGLGAQSIARIVPMSLRMDVLDLDGSEASRLFFNTLAESSDSLLVCPATDDVADGCALGGASLSPELARTRLEHEVTVASLIIPAGFGETLETGGQVVLQFRPGVGMAAPQVAFSAVQKAVTRLGGPLVATRLNAQLLKSLDIEVEQEANATQPAEIGAFWDHLPLQVITEMEPLTPGQIMGAKLLENGFSLSVPAITVTFVMISLLGLTQSLAEDRMTGILQRLGMMPISKIQWLGGKLLATFLIGWMQFAILVTFGMICGVDFGSTPLVLIAVGSAYVLAVTAMALMLASIARTPGQASALASAAWIVLVPLGGGWWPLVFVPAWMQTLGHLSPVAWCIDAFEALIFYQGTWQDLLQPTGVLLLFAILFFTIGTKKLNFHPSGDKNGADNLPFFGIQREAEQ
jgi:ABC-2 type transport system permease protein